MFAGVGEQGAEDAAYGTAVLIENTHLKGEHLSGGAADIYKCFDQILRPLIYCIIEAAGIPKGVLRAYRNFQENLVCHNTLAGCIGQAYSKPASIPQGDPFSVMLVALLLRPWVLQMKALAAYPRVLADDLQLIVTGQKHATTFQHAFDMTHTHLHDMGARLAPSKSIIFSTDSKVSKWMRTHKWRRVGTTLTVVRDCRDLGAHLNTSACSRKGTTLTQRMIRGTTFAKKGKYIRAPLFKKAAVLRGKVTPMALYQCETCPVNESVLAGLRTAYVDVLSVGSSRRSVDFGFLIFQVIARMRTQTLKLFTDVQRLSDATGTKTIRQRNFYKKN